MTLPTEETVIDQLDWAIGIVKKNLRCIKATDQDKLFQLDFVSRIIAENISNLKLSSGDLIKYYEVRQTVNKFNAIKLNLYEKRC